MNFKVNPIEVKSLWKLETYTDNVAGTIHLQIPVTADGLRDPLRLEQFGGSCMINGPAGPMNFSFGIPTAKTLAEAIEQFPAALEQALKEMQDQSLRQRIASGGGRIDLSKLKN